MIFFYSSANSMKGALVDTVEGINVFYQSGSGNALTITDNGFSVYVYGGFGNSLFYWLAVKD